MPVTVGMKSRSMRSPCLVHVTLTVLGLNPDDIHFATAVPSLSSNAGPNDVTFGCDGGTYKHNDT